MLETPSRFERPAGSRYHVSVAVDDIEIREAQRLRYRVFAEEMGARLNCREPGLDADLYDPFCDHMLVRDREDGEVVGTYRILGPEAARQVGGYYSEEEFDLARFHHVRPGMAELGRSCVDPRHRSGAVIAKLWAGLAEYARHYGHRYLVGCASISMADGGHNAANVYRHLAQRHLSPIEWRVHPRCRLPIEALDSGAVAQVPPLIKGYIRAGAWVCGEPAWDPDFNTADLFLLLPLERLDRAYAQRFDGAALR